jgi:steroid delta-isomerase-like uncharacterized protein
MTMSTDEHKAVVHRFVDEFWNRGNVDVADELLAPNAVIHEPVAGTPADLKAVAAEFRTAFPDWHSTVEEMIAEGDSVAERWTGRGTHRGALQGIPPTGKRVEVAGVVFYRFEDGRIVEFRGRFDTMSLMQQLGVAPDIEMVPS